MIEHQKHSNLFNSLNKKIEILILSIKNKTALTAVTVNHIISKVLKPAKTGWIKVGPASH
jgi:hypothetical protein